MNKSTNKRRHKWVKPFDIPFIYVCSKCGKHKIKETIYTTTYYDENMNPLGSKSPECVSKQPSIRETRMKELEIAAQKELMRSYSSPTAIISTYGESARIEKCEPFFFRQEAMIDMFRKGAEWMAKQMAWIDVNDKMPEDGREVDEKTILAQTRDVIVLYKNRCVGKGKRIYMSNKKGWQWSCLKGEDITHWMNYPN